MSWKPDYTEAEKQKMFQARKHAIRQRTKCWGKLGSAKRWNKQLAEKYKRQADKWNDTIEELDAKLCKMGRM